MTWRSRRRSVLEVPDGVYFVYLAWGFDPKRPLYVGKTRALMGRLGKHSQQSRWFDSVRRWEVYAYPSEEEALIAEGDAINELRPEYNQAGNRGAPPPMARYLRHRIPRQPVPTYGPPITTDEITAEQLAVVQRVQNRGKAA